MSLRTEVNNYFAQDRIRDHFSYHFNKFIYCIYPTIDALFFTFLLRICTRDSTLLDILSLNNSAILRVTVFLVTQKKHLVVKIGCQWQRQG